MQPGRRLTASHEHTVTFYDHDAEALGDVTAYVLEGLAGRDGAVVVATPAHRAALDETLVRAGIDPEQERLTGRFVALDAEATLATFMVNGAPERELFSAGIAAHLDAMSKHGFVRVFGEMVAVLWERGNVSGALELESLWNELAQAHEFSLLCAYPTTALDTARLGDVGRVCDLHSAVLPPASYDAPYWTTSDPGSWQRSGVFVPVPEAVGAARRFVTGVLQEWGDHRLVADAALVSSELATNAISHAASPFRLFVRRTPDTVLIAVKDAGAGRVAAHLADPGDSTGRGLDIIARVSDRWGCDALPDGKVVWAELPTACVVPA